MSVQSRRLTVLVFVCLSFAAGAQDATTAHHMAVVSQRTIKATMHVEADVDLVPREWFVAAPQPPELDRQQHITARLSPNGKSARELSSQRRPILVSRVRNSASRLSADVEYTMTLIGRALVVETPSNRSTPLSALAQSERAMWLAKSPMCSYRDLEFQRWLDAAKLRRNDDESDLEFGRRVFEYLRGEFEYEYVSELDRSLPRVCREKKSDCLGLSALFVSVLRASDVPARILVGRWSESAKPGEKLGGANYAQEHVKCEFYATDVGWIPVDPATALLQRNERLSKRQFGWDAGDFVTLHVNDQLVIQHTGNSRRTMPFLQGVFVGVLTEGRSGEVRLQLQWRVVPVN